MLAKCFTDITIQFSQQFRCYNIMFEEAGDSEIKQFTKVIEQIEEARLNSQSQLDSRTHSLIHGKICHSAGPVVSRCFIC